MGRRNYLIEGVSGSGKTTVATELERRGFDVVHGDRVLAHPGDPVTGQIYDRTDPDWSLQQRHRHWIWDVPRVRALVADHTHPVTFFCGGSRNFAAFIDLFDAVFVLEVDVHTLNTRLDARPADEFGHLPQERAFVLRLHRSREDLPAGAIRVDSTRPVGDVVDDLLQRIGSLRWET